MGSDVISWMNLAEINNLRRGQHNHEKLTELAMQAQAIGRRTGIEPMDYAEFSRKHPVRKHSSGDRFGMIAIGAAIGSAIGLGVAGLIYSFTRSNQFLDLAVEGGLFGGIFGGFFSFHDKERQSQLQRYESYLNAFEMIAKNEEKAPLFAERYGHHSSKHSESIGF